MTDQWRTQFTMSLVLPTTNHNITNPILDNTELNFEISKLMAQILSIENNTEYNLILSDSGITNPLAVIKPQRKIKTSGYMPFYTTGLQTLKLSNDTTRFPMFNNKEKTGNIVIKFAPLIWTKALEKIPRDMLIGDKVFRWTKVVEDELDELDENQKKVDKLVELELNPEDKLRYLSEYMKR